MNIKEFKKYWEILKKNYQDKTHNTDDFYMYYSIFKDYPEQDVKDAIKEVLKYQSYFPRIDEIVKYLPKHEEPIWFENKKDLIPATKEEQEEMEELINELCEDVG